MIDDNERLVVVLGMAHSGTTILTHVLSQHPELRVGVNGSEAWIYENAWLPDEDAGPIEELLAAHPAVRILLKRPWNEVRHAHWMAREMPRARFLYCFRTFEETADSWSKGTSLVAKHLRTGGIEFQRHYYEMCWEKAQEFSRRVAFVKWVYHRDFVNWPESLLAEIVAWLSISPFLFDVSQVSYDKDIKELLWRS